MHDPDPTAFDLEDFLPYLLNQAAEAAAQGFQGIYRNRYGMTRTQWRVMAHLGRFGAMTARDICARSHIEKTKVSRAVAVLEREGRLIRKPSPQDGRAEILTLTPAGRAIYADLGHCALDYDRRLRADLAGLSPDGLNRLLQAIIARRPGAG